MKRKTLFLIILFISINYIKISGETPLRDTTATSYNDGLFTTLSYVSVKGTREKANEIADYLMHDYKNNPGHLFEWAFKDLGLQESNNEIVIIPKDSYYNAKTDIATGYFDVIVPHLKTFKDVKVDFKLVRTLHDNGIISLYLDVIYSSFLIKKATGSITFIPKKSEIITVLAKGDLRFGWFFNIFITQKKYKSIVEWRIKKFATNIAEQFNVKTKKTEKK